MILLDIILFIYLFKGAQEVHLMMNYDTFRLSELTSLTGINAEKYVSNCNCCSDVSTPVMRKIIVKLDVLAWGLTQVVSNNNG